MFEPRVALASLSGQADVDWAEGGAPFAGCAFLGGIALDDATRRAARAMVKRDRVEFLPPNPHNFVYQQLRAMEEIPIRAGINVRSAALAPIEDAADLCRDHGAILEINAHCRQEEMCDAGAGETLLRDPEKLCRQVEAATATGASVSANNEVRDTESVREYLEYGADAVSVGRASDDPDVLAAVRNGTHNWFREAPL